MLKTRLSSRKKGNESLTIVGRDGEVVAKIISLSPTCEFEIDTQDGMHIEKPNGYSSKKE